MWLSYKAIIELYIKSYFNLILSIKFSIFLSLNAFGLPLMRKSYIIISLSYHYWFFQRHVTKQTSRRLYMTALEFWTVRNMTVTETWSRPSRQPYIGSSLQDRAIHSFWQVDILYISFWDTCSSHVYRCMNIYLVLIAYWSSLQFKRKFDMSWFSMPLFRYILYYFFSFSFFIYFWPIFF